MFSCPDCAVRLEAATCPRCGGAFDERDGIWRCLTPGRSAGLEPFLAQYRVVRAHDGHRPASPEYYRNLPSVAGDDPCATEWQIRRETYRNLLRHVLAGAPQSMRVLDLGAGSAWLSHRLADLGHRVVAVDVLDDEADGLGAAREYAARFALVQADFARLPFAPGQFDLVVFNASLHYARDAREALTHANTMLAAGGLLVVMDSPMFRADIDGRRMTATFRDHVRSSYGIDPVAQPGAGYVTFDALDRTAASLDRDARFVPSRGPFRWRTRRQLAWLRLRRAPAAFGLWVAR